ncbi:phosphoribosylglycinamide formyltransferase [Stenoxybacter acetivorans]|uniref:phosphoribosylglycinamide formyltransferase n=1 Tax=Stenoxybacter acetivorans TaxID=422441 RepID=UPI00055D0CC3|nr:phosphoribosylglycinamide formyltransferase [Stenoxybacter acetivorans]
MKKIVILISGRGSNMQAVVNADIAGAEIAAVISNQPDAAGLAWAAERGLTTATVNHRDYANREAFDAALMRVIDAHQPDLVLLAGFMRVLTADFCRHYQNRLINIHPSLLPAFTGLHTHQRAIDAGCRIAGCTVHFVTAELDCGPIIAQAAVPILDGDTADTLAARVLTAEHQILPQAVADFVSGSLKIDGSRVLNHRSSQIHNIGNTTVLSV